GAAHRRRGRGVSRDRPGGPCSLAIVAQTGAPPPRGVRCLPLVVMAIMLTLLSGSAPFSGSPVGGAAPHLVQHSAISAPQSLSRVDDPTPQASPSTTTRSPVPGSALAAPAGSTPSRTRRVAIPPLVRAAVSAAVPDSVWKLVAKTCAAPPCRR